MHLFYLSTRQECRALIIDASICAANRSNFEKTLRLFLNHNNSDAVPVCLCSIILNNMALIRMLSPIACILYIRHSLLIVSHSAQCMFRLLSNGFTLHRLLLSKQMWSFSDDFPWTPFASLVAHPHPLSARYLFCWKRFVFSGRLLRLYGNLSIEFTSII